MEHTTGMAADQFPHDAAGPPPPRGWRRAALTVVPLVVLAWVLFGASVALSNGHTHHESTACRWLPLPWTIWAADYGGLVAAIVAVTLPIVLARYARRRGWDSGKAWESRLSTGFAVPGWFAVLALAIAVVLAHMEAGAHHGPMCEGLGFLHTAHAHLSGIGGPFG